MILAAAIRSRWQMLRNAWRGGRGARRGGHPLVNVALVIVLAAVIGTGLSMLFGAMAASGTSAKDASGMLAIILLASIVGMLVFDVHHAVASLLVDSDLSLLRRAPITPLTLFFIKLADSLPRTSALLVIMALPAVLAFINRFPPEPWGLLLLPFQLAAFWLLPLGLGTAAAVALLRMVPARRAREALGLVSTFVLVVLWMVNAFWVPRLSESGSELHALIEASTRRDVYWDFVSPPHGLAAALSAAHDGRPARAVGLTAWWLALGTLAVSCAAWIVARSAQTLQSALAVAHSAGHGARQHGRVWQRGIARALLRRDFRLFVRDWTVLGDVLTAAVLWTLLPLLSASVLAAGPEDLVQAMLVALTVGLGYEIGARSVPFERHAAMWARLAPRAPAVWVRAKFLGALALGGPLLAAAVLAMALAVPLGPREWLATLSTATSALATALAIGIWTGLRHGDPTWTNPRAMLTVGGRILATTLLLGQAGAWLGLAAVLGSWAPAAGAFADLWLPPLVAWVLVRAVSGASTGLMRDLGWLY